MLPIIDAHTTLKDANQLVANFHDEMASICHSRARWRTKYRRAALAGWVLALLAITGWVNVVGLAARVDQLQKRHCTEVR